jgi:hypothetical protein
MPNTGSRFVCTLVLIVGVGLTFATPAIAAPRWLEEGPGPILNGQEVIPPDNPVSGAINAIVASRTDPDLVYVGTVNGGVWRTTDATADSPSWTPLTDRRLPGLSINSLAISPINSRILFARTGSTSAFGGDGSPGFGVARSISGGASWTVLAQDTFAGRKINSIVPTALEGGNLVLAATLFDGGGVFRSVDLGDSFIRLSGNGSSGLPAQGVSSLVADPGNRNRFYAAVPAIFSATGSEGVYRSDDEGLTWAAVNTGLTGLGTSFRILLAVHNNSSQGTNAVYAAILSDGTTRALEGVFRSDNLGVTLDSAGCTCSANLPSRSDGAAWGCRGRSHGPERCLHCRRRGWNLAR